MIAFHSGAGRVGSAVGLSNRSAEKSYAGGEAVVVEPNEIDGLPDVSVIVIRVT
jgi:hypothetical protein